MQPASESVVALRGVPIMGTAMPDFSAVRNPLPSSACVVQPGI